MIEIVVKSLKAYKQDIDDTGCITETHQCGPCPYNQQCAQSTKNSVQEPSASDWGDPDCLPRIERELRFD